MVDMIEEQDIIDNRGIRTITFKEFKALGVSKMKPKPKVVFINKREAFNPPDDNIDRFNDLLRRFSSERRHTPESAKGTALYVSNYDVAYRRKIMRNAKAMKTMRKLSELSRKRLVYLVSTNDLPNGAIIADICKALFGGFYNER